MMARRRGRMQGKFRPLNPVKYQGDIKNIVYRSSLEWRFMRYCDNNDEILAWSSEEVIVPYVSIDKKWHRYFPDFVIKTKKEEVIMVEIKPASQTIPPVKGKSQRRYITEALEYGKNQAKWNAAIPFCEKKGWRFQIITEKDLKNYV
jgi:hypothetical protein